MNFTTRRGRHLSHLKGRERVCRFTYVPVDDANARTPVACIRVWELGGERVGSGWWRHCADGDRKTIRLCTGPSRRVNTARNRARPGYPGCGAAPRGVPRSPGQTKPRVHKVNIYGLLKLFAADRPFSIECACCARRCSGK